MRIHCFLSLVPLVSNAITDHSGLINNRNLVFSLMGNPRGSPVLENSPGFIVLQLVVAEAVLAVNILQHTKARCNKSGL